MSGRVPALIVIADEARGVALVKGIDAQRCVYLVSPSDFHWVPKYSRSGRGWTIPVSAVVDLVAWGQQNRELVVVHRRKAQP
jgi:hypothetical protein